MIEFNVLNDRFLNLIVVLCFCIYQVLCGKFKKPKVKQFALRFNIYLQFKNASV